MIIQAYKNTGETPLDLINRLKNENSAYKHLPMTYAGRLDPMAEGLMVILTGEDCTKKDEYTNLPKGYEVTVLFGFSTDTNDLLGLVENVQVEFDTILDQLPEVIKKFVGKLDQRYPSYSSRTVAGKPLWEWAREGRLHEITIPTHEVYISEITIKDYFEISKDELQKYINEQIAKVKGGFRQPEILSSWRQKLDKYEDQSFLCVKLFVSCSSGTYVRVLAHEIGRNLDTYALAMHIKRTQIGDYTI